MLLGSVVMGAALLLAVPQASGPKNDVLHMKNGDKLTCEIKTMDAGALLISLDYVDGTVAVEWSRVRQVESSRLFIVKLVDGSSYTGTMSILPSETSDSVLVRLMLLDGTSIAFDKSQISGLGGTSDRFWGRFNGSLSSGFGYTKGNQNTTFNVSTAINYPRDRWSAAFGYNSNLSSAVGTTASTRNQANLGVSKLLRWRNWFYAGALAGLQSTEQSIDLQGSFSGGVGRYLKNTSSLKISLLGGAGYQSTRYSSDIAGPSEEVIAVVLGANLNWVKFKKTSLTFRFNALPALNDLGRVYVNTNAAYFLKLFGEINWTLSFYGNWDTDPPAGSSGTDYGVNSGLSWTFGNE